MPFTAKLLMLPPWLLFILINALFIGVSILLLYIVRGCVHYQIRKGHNDVAASIFNKAGTVFGIMLAFVVVISWQEYNKSMDRALREGTEALELFQDLSLYPNQKQAADASKSLILFAELVIKDEYPAMANMKMSPTTERAMNELRNEIRRISPQNRQEQILYTKILKNLENLSKLRQERLADMESSIPGIVWGALIVGAIVTIMFSILLGAEKLWLHSLLISLLAVILATAFYLIIELDYPFMGELSAKPTSYIKMLQEIEMR
jgi:phosphatidylglycerophosphate synthase